MINVILYSIYLHEINAHIAHIHNNQNELHYIMNGWLIVDKQAGMTSMDVSREIIKALRQNGVLQLTHLTNMSFVSATGEIMSNISNIETHNEIIYDSKETAISKTKYKIGHAGTLDPFATGLLPIAIGEATKLISLFMNVTKAYVFKMRFGEKRDTGDVTGKIIETDDISQKNITKERLQEIMKNFIGIIQQTPHKMSAIRVDGQRAYDLFRDNVAFELEARNIEIHELRLLEFNMISDTQIAATLYVKCGKGTYVRSLCEDIASALNTVAYVETLDRVEYGNIVLNRDVQYYAKQPVLDVSACSQWFAHVYVDEAAANTLRHGCYVKNTDYADSNMCIVLLKNEVVCIAQCENGILKPLRVLKNHVYVAGFDYSMLQ